MTEGHSVVEQIEAQAGEQAKVRATEAIRRTGAEDAEGVTEYLANSFAAAKELAQNQEEFLAKIKRIKSDVDLTDSERLAAAREAAELSRERHEELTSELASQTRTRAEKLDEKLYATTREATLTLNALADLDRNQLDTRAEIARTAGDVDMLRAVRAVAATKGFDTLVTKTVAFDPDAQVAGAYIERQRLGTSGALGALSNAYLPPPITEQQLKPSSADVERAKQAQLHQEAASKRILSGNPGITDTDFSVRPRSQVGSRRV